MRYARASLTTGQFLLTAVAGASFAVDVLAHDHFFASCGFVLLLIAWLLSTVQLGLVYRRAWARRVAIGLSCLQIPSLAFPLALLSLRGLLHRDVAVLFQSSPAQADSVAESVIAPASASLTRSQAHLRAAGVILLTAFLVFSCLTATGLVRREMRRTSAPHLSSSRVP